NDGARRARALRVACELAGAGEALGADADEHRHAPVDLVQDLVGQGLSLIRSELQHLPGHAERDETVGAAVDREPHHAPLRREVEELVRRLRAAGSEAEYVPADVRDEAAVERVIETAMRRFGRIDVLCNNAGVGLLRDVVNTSRDEYDEVFDTNVRSIFLCSR